MQEIFLNSTCPCTSLLHYNKQSSCRKYVGQKTVFDIATHYGPDGQGIESRWGEIFRRLPEGP